MLALLPLATFTVPVLRRDGADGPGLAEHFEHLVRPLSAGVAVPLFAFFAAGVSVGGWSGLTASWQDPVALGIIAGLLVGKTLGISLSTWLLARLSSRVISWIFLVVMVATAIRMCFGDPPAGTPSGLQWWEVLVLGLIGVVVGILSGLVGVGGGIIIVPTLSVGLGIDALLAKGASLVAMIPNAVVSSVLNLRRRNADLAAGLTIGIAGCLTTVLGSLVAVWIDPRVGSIVFAVFLLLVAAQMLIRLLRAPRTRLTTADEPAERSVHDEVNPVEMDEEFGEDDRR